MSLFSFLHNYLRRLRLLYYHIRRPSTASWCTRTIPFVTPAECSVRRIMLVILGFEILISAAIIKATVVWIVAPSHVLVQWYSTFFVRVPPDVISFQLCTSQSCWYTIQVIHSL
jgi:hypothetical protein